MSQQHYFDMSHDGDIFYEFFRPGSYIGGSVDFIYWFVRNFLGMLAILPLMEFLRFNGHLKHDFGYFIWVAFWWSFWFTIFMILSDWWAKRKEKK